MTGLKYEIYGLYDPRNPQVLRYIGQTSKGTPQRLRRHVSLARRVTPGPRYHVTNWIVQLLSEGFEPRLMLLVTVKTQAEANWWERDLIGWFRDHPLTNMTTGGEGVSELTPEGRAKQLAALRNRAVSDEERRRRSEQMRMLWADPAWKAETAARISRALIARADRLNPVRHAPKPAQSPKTHCPNGHPYVRDEAGRARKCRSCQNERAKRVYAEGHPRRDTGRTHCAAGHVFDEDNTYVTKSGYSLCRKCAAERARSKRVPRVRAAATHCRRGHEFTPENTYTYRGARKCRTCTLERQRAARSR